MRGGKKGRYTGPPRRGGGASKGRFEGAAGGRRFTPYGNAQREDREGGGARGNDDDVETFSTGTGVAMIAKRYAQVEQVNAMDLQMGFENVATMPVGTKGLRRRGWLVNMKATLVKDSDWLGGRSAVDYYFVAGQEITGGHGAANDDVKTLSKTANMANITRENSTDTTSKNAAAAYFKATVVHSPYFYLKCRWGREATVEEWLQRKFGRTIESVERSMKEDLGMPNHLSKRATKRVYLKVTCRNTYDLDAVRRALLPIVEKNQEGYDERLDYLAGMAADEGAAGDDDQEDPEEDEWMDITAATKSSHRGGKKRSLAIAGPEGIVDIREHDVPYALRVSIDKGICAGLWYDIRLSGNTAIVERVGEQPVRPDPVVLAFDIETYKKPLRFPDAASDPIMMISYMIDGRGYLIANRQIVGDSIEGTVEYTPKPEYQGVFTCFDEADERALLNRFFAHIQLVCPSIYVTYNGDSFDWPYVDARARHHGLDMRTIVGVYGTKVHNGARAEDATGDGDEDAAPKVVKDVYEYGATYAVHMDCFRWVKRDSYLPAGSQGLKAVTTAKLGYDPVELDPELMVEMAQKDPKTLVRYSVSDSVATYYLYMKYVHPFIFSLCNIIPLTPDEVLRKGSGTLCETLLMADAFEGSIIMPNKHRAERERYHEGRLLDSETYVGGHVEALEAGVFRSDFTYRFASDVPVLREMLANVDSVLEHALHQDAPGVPHSSITNLDAVRGDVVARLERMIAEPVRVEPPGIYHLDVAAMYPNIILTNRLQPSAMVDPATCALCEYNRPGAQCKRKLDWAWRGEYYMPNAAETQMVRDQLAGERFRSNSSNNYNQKEQSKDDDYETVEDPVEETTTTTTTTTTSSSGRLGDGKVPYGDLPRPQRMALFRKRLGQYAMRVYRRVRGVAVVPRTATVCMRENPFYIDCVRRFRDRRYEYKDLLKRAKREETGERQAKLCVLYDSLQLAHKCILNSFYGYVMRKGARWYSMEMAAVVCDTGSRIIRMTRQLVEAVGGRPLELDTDGIWCMLPGTFPQAYTLELAGGKKLPLSYSCALLNWEVERRFANPQYQTGGPREGWRLSRENSIAFEIDGPYHAMILPSSMEEGRQLKKRYAVFTHEGKLAELKGFEVKRRGEMRILKDFQNELFRSVLKGTTLAECYAAMSAVATRWLNILREHGGPVPSDSELLDLLCESKSMSRGLGEYSADQKSTTLGTARRLAEFLGEEAVLGAGSGLACKYVVASRPAGAPVADRTIPTIIFGAGGDSEEKRAALRRWLGISSSAKSSLSSTTSDPSGVEEVPTDIRDFIDWAYYEERIASVACKLIVIPAAAQAVTPSPLPSVAPPAWLAKQITVRNDAPGGLHQRSLGFTPIPVPSTHSVSATKDIEDIVVSCTKKQTLRDLVRPEVSMDVDYAAWLRNRKPKWRALRKAAPWKNPSTSTTTTTTINNQAGGFFTSEADLMGSHPWEVVDIQAATAQETRLWVRFSRTATCRLVTLRTPPRSIYIQLASAEDVPDFLQGCERVHRNLPPYGQPCRLLWRVPVPAGCSGDAGQMQAALTRLAEYPQVVAVWEADVPVALETVIRSGCVARYNGSNGSGSSSTNLQADALVLLETPEQSYLDGMSYSFVWRQDDPSSRRRFTTVATYKSTLVGITVLVPEGAATQFAVRQVLERLSIPVETPVSIASYTDEHSYTAALMKSLGSIQGPKTVVDLSGQSQPVDFPWISYTGQLPTLQFPTLDWQRLLLRRSLEAISKARQNVTDCLGLARYAHVPLGVLLREGPAAYDYVRDVFLARALRADSFLLQPSTPCRLSSPLIPSISLAEDTQTTTTTTSRDMSLVEGRPGAYVQHVSVEVDLTGFTLNALLEHLSKEDLAAEGGRKKRHVILTHLLLSWVRSMSAAPEGSSLRAHCESVLRGAPRWILSPEASRLHCPETAVALTRVRNRLAQSLATVLRKMGALVVRIDPAASVAIIRTPIRLHDENDPSVVLVDVDHSDEEDAVAAARAYMSYVLGELRTSPAFPWVDFSLRRLFTGLLWYDPANHAARITSAAETEETAAPVQFSTLSQWALCELLPPALKEPFSAVMEDTLVQLLKQWPLPPPTTSGGTSSRKEDVAFIQDPSSCNTDPAAAEDDDQTCSPLFDSDTAFLSEFRHRFLSGVRQLQRICSTSAVSVPNSPFVFPEVHISSSSSSSALNFNPHSADASNHAVNAVHTPPPNTGAFHFVKHVAAVWRRIFIVSTSSTRNRTALSSIAAVQSRAFHVLLSHAWSLLGINPFAQEAAPVPRTAQLASHLPPPLALFCRACSAESTLLPCSSALLSALTAPASSSQEDDVSTRICASLECPHCQAKAAAAFNPAELRAAIRRERRRAERAWYSRADVQCVPGGTASGQNGCGYVLEQTLRSRSTIHICPRCTCAALQVVLLD